MREIKFRGKTKEGQWIIGSYFCMHHNEDRDHLHHFIISDGTPIPKNKTIGDIQVEVAKSSIGQFTGLQDSKGNDIYEGDILCIKQHELDILRGVFRETEIICVVEFRNGTFIPVMRDGKGYCWSNFIYDKKPTADYTVIGNIHDNPEMMEVNQ